MKIAIDGTFLCHKNPIGVARVAYDTILELDKIVNKDDFELIIPLHHLYDIELHNIKKVYHQGKGFKKNFKIFWNYIYLTQYVKKNKCVPLSIHGSLPVTLAGYCYIHDINAIQHPENFIGIKQKILRFMRIIEMYFTVKKSKHLFTVSNYQKEQINKHYNLSESMITVIYSGWEHMQRFETDMSIFNKHDKIERKKYFFAVGTVTKYKNFYWILCLAKNNPQYQFVFAGPIFKSELNKAFDIFDELENVMFLGYVSDNELKALMSECKAFIYPSFYEGFGLPPLEAISCGSQAIVSNATCLPEIYENCVFYIDPNNTVITIEEILNQTPENPQRLLEKYSWVKTAKNLYDEIKKNENYS